MVIGIPKEIMHGEGRVSAIPETVSLLKEEGFDVLVENTAGEGALFSDAEYVAAGATMIADSEELYAKSDIILKVKEPQFTLHLLLTTKWLRIWLQKA